jgi:hypothetical protein
MLVVVISFACLHVVGIVALMFAARNAPFGFEDERGFHIIDSPFGQDGELSLHPVTKNFGNRSRRARLRIDKSFRSVHFVRGGFRRCATGWQINGRR